MGSKPIDCLCNLSIKKIKNKKPGQERSKVVEIEK